MTYWTLPLAGIALGILLFCFRVRRCSMPLRTALTALPLGGFFALAGAKLFSLMLEWRQWSYDDVGYVLSDFSADALCAVGGCAGACLGIVLAARLLRQRPLRLLDAYAPCGALALIGFRCGEYFLGRLGAGMYLEKGSALARFPFAVVNDWGEHYLAVFTLEALWALVALIVSLTARHRREGDTFRWTAWMLASGQIFLEDLRARGMMMGFVHTEQVLCGVICLALCLAACRRRGNMRPFWAAFGMIVLIGLTEFARQKSSTAFLSEWGYLLVALECAALAIPYARAMKEAV